jgi:hypothetical protein
MRVDDLLPLAQLRALESHRVGDGLSYAREQQLPSENELPVAR